MQPGFVSTLGSFLQSSCRAPPLGKLLTLLRLESGHVRVGPANCFCLGLPVSTCSTGAPSPMQLVLLEQITENNMLSLGSLPLQPAWITGLI